MNIIKRILPENCQAWLPMQEGTGSTSADRSGNSSPLTMGSAASWVDTPFGKGIRTQGAMPSTWAYIADTTNLSIPTNRVFTIEVIAKTDLCTQTGGNPGYLLGKGTSNQWEYMLGIINNPSGTYRFSLEMYSLTGTSYVVTTSVATLSLGMYYYFVVTGDGTNYAIYINGVFDKTAAFGVGIPGNGTANLAIGNRTYADLPIDNATLCHFSVHSRCKSAAEVAATWGAHKGILCG